MIAYLDCFSGVSGDKFLGALVDAGLDPAVLADALDAVLPGEAEISCDRVRSGGIAAVRVTVAVAEPQPARRWRDLRGLLEGAELDPAVRERSLAVFAAIAAAEAAVHGVAVDDVHFHEVGAVDSVADIVGACAGLAALGVTRLFCSPVAVGGGVVRTEHGVLPVPAPATAALLEGVPVEPGPASSELTTPTGAALVRVLAEGFGPMPAITPMRSGYGAGTRDLRDDRGAPVPNVLRLMLGVSPAAETTGGAAAELATGIAGGPSAGLAEEPVAILRTVVDHVSAERLAFAVERVLAAGALDAWQRPVFMKKGRLGTEITVLAAPPDAHALADALVRHTGTLGVRIEPGSRLVADREPVLVTTRLGDVRLKRGPGSVLRPEHDDLARIATAEDLTLEEVERIVAEALDATKDADPGPRPAGP